ncbi:Uncharacterized protein APZ42_020934 [Daphnia magna]|uniref:Uncharacterized protein n=1 Tax=Daphnia magna TaxID=35525 RepID=A0A164X465_9CRUS|nr:Uncharacterized protein APZ42_020934 [Daphnia magna]
MGVFKMLLLVVSLIAYSNSASVHGGHGGRGGHVGRGDRGDHHMNRRSAQYYTTAAPYYTTVASYHSELRITLRQLLTTPKLRITLRQLYTTRRYMDIVQ